MSTAPAYNVPFICTDQQRADHSAFMGNRVPPASDARRTGGRSISGPTTSRCTPRGSLPSAHRFARNSKGEEQLFSLQDDPEELRDCKRSDPGLRWELLERLTDALIEADDCARGAPVATYG